jgi:hypothetical protein
MKAKSGETSKGQSSDWVTDNWPKLRVDPCPTLQGICYKVHIAVAHPARVADNRQAVVRQYILLERQTRVDQNRKEDGKLNLLI